MLNSNFIRRLTLSTALLTLVSIAKAATSVTQYGITWTFNADYSTGQYCNGDTYVVAPSGLSITGISPGSTIDTVVDAGRVMSGTMVNPIAGESNAQGWDTRSSDNYQAALNKGRPGGNALSSSNPLIVAAGSSVVTQISMLNPSKGWGNRPMTSDAAVLTVVSSAPASGSFRPPYCGTNKTHYWNKADLNYGILGNYAAVTNTPTLATTAVYNARPWIEVCTTWQGTQGHPINNQPEYGRDMAVLTGNALLRLMVSGTNAEKETAYINLVQYGIDIYGAAVSGAVWNPDGGHNMGRKAILTLAGKALNDSNILAYADKNQHNIFQDDISAVLVDATVEATIPYTNDGNVRSAFAPQSSVVTISNGSPAVITWPTTSATVTISNGSPAIITWANHGLQNTRAVQFSSTGTLPTGLSPGVTYWVQPANLTANTFSVATSINVAALGGSLISTSSAGSGAFTATVGHGFKRSMPITFSTTGTLPSPLVAGVEYWIRDPGTSLNTFTIGAVAFNDDAVGYGGGDPVAINTTTAGSGTQTASFALTGKVVWASKGTAYDRAGSNFDVNYHGINMMSQSPLALGVMMMSGGKAAWNNANYFTMIDREVTVSNYYGSPNTFVGYMWKAYRAGIGGESIAPIIAISAPTSGSSYSTSTGSLTTLAGTASDNVGVTSVTWSNSAGGSGAATGTTSWSVPSITLSNGSNVITVTARDASGNTAATTLTVTYSGGVSAVLPNNILVTMTEASAPVTGNPAFGAEDTRGGVTNSVSSVPITLVKGMNVGDRVVLAYTAEGAAAVSSVTDSAGNTYTLMKSQGAYNDPSYYTSIYSAHVATALAPGATLTVNLSAGYYSTKSWFVAKLTGCAANGQPNQTSGNSSYGTAVSASASPSIAPTILFGVVKARTSETYSGSAWTAIGAAQDSDGGRSWFLRKSATDNAAQNVGGTLSGNQVYYALWVSFN